LTRTTITCYSRTVALVCGAAAAGLFVASLERIPGARDLVGLPRAACVLGGIGVYVAFVWWTARRDPGALRAAALPTVVAGVAFVAHICVENFVRVPRALDPWVTLAFMLVIFASFGAAGHRGYRRSVRASTGLTAAFSAAAIGVLIALDCGFLLNVVAAPRLAQNLGAEAAQHHLAPTVAFTVLNSSESALELLTEAPAIALVVGLLGVGLARFTPRS
jgi:hypothetical protein